MKECRKLLHAFDVAKRFDTLLDCACDDPAGLRCQLDDLARLATAAAGTASPDRPLELDELAELAREAWRLVDALDRLRESAVSARLSIALYLDDRDWLLEAAGATEGAAAV